MDLRRPIPNVTVQRDSTDEMLRADYRHKPVFAVPRLAIRIHRRRELSFEKVLFAGVWCAACAIAWHQAGEHLWRWTFLVFASALGGWLLLWSAAGAFLCTRIVVQHGRIEAFTGPFGLKRVTRTPHEKIVALSVIAEEKGWNAQAGEALAAPQFVLLATTTDGKDTLVLPDIDACEEANLVKSELDQHLGLRR